MTKSVEMLIEELENDILQGNKNNALETLKKLKIELITKNN